MGEGLLPEEGWGRMGVALPVVRRPVLGMKAEMIPDWVLTGNIWQMIWGLVMGGGDRVEGAGGLCRALQILSKDGCEGAARCSVCTAVGGVLICPVFDRCSCGFWRRAGPVGLFPRWVAVVGMWFLQWGLSAVWRMTLVAMALQGCGGVFSAMGARTGWCSPDEQRWDGTEPEESTKLGLCGGVMHREESDTKSLGDSDSSGAGRESQESEAGVRGRGLRRKGAWPQELMQTKASAASRSVYSSPVLAAHCSLSCLLFFDWGP